MAKNPLSFSLLVGSVHAFEWGSDPSPMIKCLSLLSLVAPAVSFARSGPVPTYADLRAPNADRSKWHLPAGSTFCLKYPQACEGPKVYTDICVHRPSVCSGSWTADDVVNISKSRLVGTLPTEIGLNANYDGVLDLRGNSLSGTIPTQMGKLTKISGLFLNVNSLTGSIPSELAKLVHATGLKLHDNHLSGTIPSQFGMLDNLYCQEECHFRNGLDLHWNFLSGTIPQHLSHFVHIDCSLISYKKFGTNMQNQGLWQDTVNTACPTPRTAFTNSTFASHNYPLNQYMAGWTHNTAAG